MKHSINVENNGPFAEHMAKAVETCVHCGFCLPTCPTYQELGQEADSPRGRIVLMKQVLEGHLESSEVETHIDQCLGCLACETACPSGVQYRDLISPYRATYSKKKSFFEWVRDKIVAMTIPYPGRFRWALRLGKLTKPLSFLAPSAFKPMTELIPDEIPPTEKLKSKYLATGARKMRVAMLSGCAQQVLAPEINRYTIELLTHCGAEVLIPEKQGCCGALSWHNGNANQAKHLAERNLTAFPDDVDWIVTNAAGCGSGMQEYGLIFSGTKHAERAERLSKKVIDVSVLLEKLQFEKRISQPDSGASVKVAYHDACHLSNGQNVTSQPRRLLKAIANLELVEIPNSEICCGSAGTYNIDQPMIAGGLGKKKAAAVISTDAKYLVTGNIGCIVQIRNHLKALGSDIKVLHLVEFLAKHVVSTDEDTVREKLSETVEICSGKN